MIFMRVPFGISCETFIFLRSIYRKSSQFSLVNSLKSCILWKVPLDIFSQLVTHSTRLKSPCKNYYIQISVHPIFVVALLPCLVNCVK